MKRGGHINLSIGNIVFINIKKQIKDIKNVGVKWIDHFTVVYERPGPLFDIKYEFEVQVTKYLQIHPEFKSYMLEKSFKW